MDKKKCVLKCKKQKQKSLLMSVFLLGGYVARTLGVCVDPKDPINLGKEGLDLICPSTRFSNKMSGGSLEKVQRERERGQESVVMYTKGSQLIVWSGD